MMIITIPLYNGCSPIGKASFYPNKIKYAKLSGNLNNIATNRDDVAAIVIDEKETIGLKNQFILIFGILFLYEVLMDLLHQIAAIYLYYIGTNTLQISLKKILLKNL